jgi:autotransporter-associated beta strand protein
MLLQHHNPLIFGRFRQRPHCSNPKTSGKADLQTQLTPGLQRQTDGSVVGARGSALSKETIKTRRLLGSLALIGGAGTLVFAAPQSALAACVITQPSQFLFTCAVNTTTTTGFNVIAPGSTSAANQSSFLTGVDVVINPGVVISGNGLNFSVVTSSPEKITNNGAAINTNLFASGVSARGLNFSNGGLGGSISYVGNGSASSVNGWGLFLIADSVQMGTPATPVVPNYTGPSSIVTGGLNVGAFVSASAYLSGGSISGGLQFAQIGHNQPAILTLTGHTKITADPNNFGVGIFTAGPVILTSDANIGDADHRVRIGISANSFGSATTVNGVPINVTQGAGSSIFANTYGIYAVSSDAPGIVNVTTNGAISVKGGTGVLAASGFDFGSGNVTVSHNGAINTEPGTFSEIGLYARAFRAGNVAVGVTGNISTSSATSSVGLAATATSGNITIDIAPGATIKTGGIGILAGADSGTTMINNLGTVSGGVSAARFIGTMNVGNGGTTGTIIGDVLDRGTLNFNRSDAVTYSGIISDTGRVQQNGSGVLTLSGINTYTGFTNVNAGTLIVNGSIASSPLTTVNAGATLGGNGTVANTTINGGALAPGNSIGTFTVQGNLVFTAAASYMVEVSPANADRTNVTGKATLGGATVKASFAPGTYVARQYTILNAAGGVGETFNTLVNTDLPANFKSSLSYDSKNAYLDLALIFVPPPSGLNANQQSAANAIVGFFNSNGGIPLVFGGLTPAGLTQISGEVATGTQQTTFNAMNQFMGVMTDPFIAGRGDPVSVGASAPQFAEESDAANAYAADNKPRSKSERDAYAAVYRKAPVTADPFTQRWSVWAAGYGGSQTTDGNTALGSNNTRSSIGGVAVGADYRFSPYTIAGFALAGGGTNFSVNGLGSGRSDLFQAGAFVRHNVGAAYLTGALAYGWQDITTDRTVTVAGTDLLRAQFNANAFSGRAEGGYRFATPWIGGIGITPYAAGQFVTFDLPAYAEQAIAGANTFALSYAGKSVTDTRSELGLRSDKSFAMPNGIFILRGRAAWAHDFNTDRSITPTFQTLPGASFVVNGATPAHDAALVTASAEMKWLSGFSLAGTFEGEFSNVTTSYAGKGVVRYAW